MTNPPPLSSRLNQNGLELNGQKPIKENQEFIMFTEKNNAFYEQKSIIRGVHHASAFCPCISCNL